MKTENSRADVMLPSDYLRKGFCNGPFSAEDAFGLHHYPNAHAARYSVDGAVSAYLESVYDAESDDFGVANLLWLVGIHREVERVFPQWLSNWHEQVEPEECCFHPLDMVLSFSGEHSQADCIRILEGVERESIMATISETSPNNYAVSADVGSGLQVALLPSVG